VCKQCGRASICEHNRRRSACKQCGGSSICEHNRKEAKASSAANRESTRDPCYGILDFTI
jgi:hypothetical protein